MLIDYTKYKDYNKLEPIFQEIKTLYDVEKDMKDFRVEDWNEDWDKGIHDQKVETYSYDIYNRFVDRQPTARYESIVNKIKNLKGISYSAIIIVNPQSEMLEHTDWSHIEGMPDDAPDKTFTLMYYLKQPKSTIEHCGMQWGDKKLYLPEDSILCLDGGRVPHGVYNNTDERRITFCLSLLEDSFDL